MNRVALILAAMVSAFSASSLFAQQIRMPKNVFPPDISPPVITVTGIDGKATIVTLADLSGLSQQTMNTTEHGTRITYEGVLLSDVLALVQTPTGDAFRQSAASFYVVVRAVDGYKAVFSWAEVGSDVHRSKGLPAGETGRTADAGSIRPVSHRRSW